MRNKKTDDNWKASWIGIAQCARFSRIVMEQRRNNSKFEIILVKSKIHEITQTHTHEHEKKTYQTPRAYCGGSNQRVLQ